MTTLREALERAAAVLGKPGPVEFEQSHGYLYARIAGEKSHPGYPCAKNAEPVARAWAESRAMRSLAERLAGYSVLGAAAAEVVTEGRALMSAVNTAGRAAAELSSAQKVVEEMEARLAVCRARRDEARVRVERERVQLVAAQAAYEAARAAHPQAAEAFDARAALEAVLKGGV